MGRNPTAYNGTLRPSDYQKPTETHLENFGNICVSSIEQILDEALNRTFPELSKELGQNFVAKGSYPKIDIIDKNTHIIIEAEIPGLTKDDVTIQITDNILSIRGNKHLDNTKEVEGKYIRKEIKRSSFERSIRLNPETMDKNTTTAKFENGSLFITIQKLKKVEPKPEVIAVKIN